MTKRTKLSFRLPTPKWATNIFNTWIALSGVTALVLVTFHDYIPVITNDVISRVLILGTPALRIITKSFGVELKEDER